MVALVGVLAYQGGAAAGGMFVRQANLVGCLLRLRRPSSNAHTIKSFELDSRHSNNLLDFIVLLATGVAACEGFERRVIPKNRALFDWQLIHADDVQRL